MFWTVDILTQKGKESYSPVFIVEKTINEKMKKH